MLKKSQDILFSRFFSSFFLLCYPKLQKKNLEFFFLNFFWVNLKDFFVKLISSFFSRFSFLEFFFLSFTYEEYRDFLCIEFLELFSLPKN
jgi:hypothetical protein